MVSSENRGTGLETKPHRCQLRKEEVELGIGNEFIRQESDHLL